MNFKFKKTTGVAALALMAAPALFSLVAPVSAVSAQAVGELNVLSIGRGKQINLPTAITDVFVANPAVADVDVKSPRQIYILGKGQGETTLYATDAAGRTVYSTTIRVGGNIDSIDQMLTLTMPEAKISASTMNGIVLLTGTVERPDDAAEAEELVKTFVGEGIKVVSRLKVSTPLQVNLRVRFAEVNRSLAKEISSNLASRDNSSGMQLGVMRGRSGALSIADKDISSYPVLDTSATYGLPAGSVSGPVRCIPGVGCQVINQYAPGTDTTFTNIAGSNMLGIAGQLFGLDVAAGFDLSEKMGLTAMLAEPNLTVTSGATGEFLAGGEIPIPVSQGNGAVSVEYKSYGVSLSYSPTVLSNGRISLRLRPEVSELADDSGSTINGFFVPGVRTRRVETTVELGSGQSFMIAGLLSNGSSSILDKMPGAGDIPILGALFKSDQWRRNETELVVIVTPYLVQPVNDERDIKLPTDGFRMPTDGQRIFFNKESDGLSGAERPSATIQQNGSYTPAATPGVSSVPAYNVPDMVAAPAAKKSKKSKSTKSGPGFSFD